MKEALFPTFSQQVCAEANRRVKREAFSPARGFSCLNPRVVYTTSGDLGDWTHHTYMPVKELCQLMRIQYRTQTQEESDTV